MRDHFGHQYRFERTDPTGRFVRLSVDAEPAWMPWVGGMAAGVMFALMMWVSL